MKTTLLLIIGLAVCCAARRQFTDERLRRCAQLIPLTCPIPDFCIPDRCRVQRTIDAYDNEMGVKIVCPGCDTSTCGYKRLPGCHRFSG